MHIWNLKYDTNKLIYERDSQTENRLVIAKGEGWCGRDGVGGWGEQMQTIIYKMNKQQGPTV